MNAGDLLTQLRTTFPEGRTTGTFDAERVAGGEYVPLLKRRGVPTELRLDSDSGWQIEGDGVRLEGTLSGPDPVLGLAGAPILIRFTPSGTDFVLLIDLGLPRTWHFGQSFGLLAAGVYEELHLDPKVPATLAIASADTADPRRDVDGTPGTAAQGLSFHGAFLGDSPVLSLIEWILTGGAPGPVNGVVGYDDTRKSVDMEIDLARGSAANPLGAGSDVTFDLDLYSGLDPGTNHYVAGLRFTADLEFDTQAGKETVRLTALLVASVDGVLELSLASDAFAFPSPSQLARWFGADHGILDALPKDLQDLSILQVDDITTGIGLVSQRLEYVFMTVGVLGGKSWTIWPPDVIEAGNFRFVFSVFQPLDAASRTFSFDFLADVDFGGVVPMLLQGDLPSERFTGRLRPDKPPPSLVPLVEHVFKYDNGLPQELVIDVLDFSADLLQNVYSFEIDIEGEWAFEFGTDNEVLFEDLRIAFAWDPDGPSGEVAGRFAVGQNDFAVTFDMAKGNTVFIGEWEATGEPLTYQDIAIALGMYELPQLPDALNLELQGATFEFESATEGTSFTFAISTASKTDAALVAGKDATGTWGFVFGMILGLALSVDLTDIPVIGKLVPAGDDVITLHDLRVVGASRAVPPFTPTDRITRALGTEVSSGLVLSIALDVGTAFKETFTVRFGGADDGSKYDVPPSSTDTVLPQPLPAPSKPVPAGTSGSAVPGPQATWINVQRAFGPVQFKRAGFALRPDDKLGLLVDGSVSLAGLSVDLIGLEADIPLQPPHTPSFGLAGLGVGFTGGGLEIAGSLMSTPGKDPAEYTGMLTIAYGSFGATAIGAYTTVDGKPSLFAFLAIRYPLGGPPFFFVTGMAGGFGYNRDLKLPTVDAVPAFPLVRAAVGTLSPADAQAQIEASIKPELGEYWLAAGVQFTSFEMLKSFALLTVAFGAHVEIALLGQATLAIPTPVADDTAPPVAQAELALIVDYSPGLGQLAVAAQLTPASYVFDRSAQLTGGFALYVWFPPSDHRGDFVVTLGGYNPYWTPLSHYPQLVPRIGLNWQVSTELTVKGGLYFALTPQVIMAGGSLDANWHSGKVRAWFSAQADFLIRFKPFRYRIDASVSIGASFTIDLWFTTKTITIHVGVYLHIAGPQFGGNARVDLSIISFTIKFGADPPQDPQPLGWPDFRKSFLPPANPTERDRGRAVTALAAGAPAVPTATDSLITIAAPSGLASTLGDAHGAPWVVDPGALQVVVTTQVPSKAATFKATTTAPLAGTWNSGFGVGPMSRAPGEVEVSLELELKHEGAPAPDSWSASAMTGHVPTGVWLNAGADPNSAPLVRDVLTGAQLSPRARPVGDPLQARAGDLLVGDPPLLGYGWSGATVPTSDDFGDTDPWQAVAGMADGDPAAARQQIVAALQAQGLVPEASPDVAAFAEEAREVLSAPPLLRVLGEARPAGVVG